MKKIKIKATVAFYRIPAVALIGYFDPRVYNIYCTGQSEAPITPINSINISVFQVKHNYNN